jgi:uncharacterized protein
VTYVFADSFYYIALLNPTDAFHAAAMTATESLVHPLLTTHCVLVEVADALSAPSIRRSAFRLLQHLTADPGTRVIGLDPDLYDRGLALFGARPDKSWSLTDCISFLVMREHATTDALTGDHHFVQAGFRALLPPNASV